MSQLAQTMKMVYGSDTYQIPFYTTQEEASTYGDCGKAEVGGVICYYPLGQATNESNGLNVKTPCKVIKNNVTNYILTSAAQMLTITVIQPFGGTITVNNQSGTTFEVRKGSNVTLTATTDTGFNFYGWREV